MERIVATFKRPISNVGEAAFLLGAFTLLSQILGLFRDRGLASVFGAGRELDIYYAAFRFPDLIFVTVASLVSMSVLIPYFSDAKNRGKEQFDILVSDVFACFSLAVIVVCFVVFIFLPALIGKTFPGFSVSEIEQVVLLSRIILLSPILLGFSNLLGSVSQVYGRFAAYAVAPALYNLGIILGTFFLVPYFGISGVAMGVALGALLHLLVQAFSLRDIVNIRDLLQFREKFSQAFSRIKSIALVSIPRTIALSSTNLALLGLLSIGSLLSAGTISVFTFSNNLQTVVVSIVGISFATAVFPVLSNFFKQNEIERMRGEFVNTARKVIFFTIPATCFLIVFRAHIVRLILGSGQFSWQDTRLVAAALAIFALSIVFQSLYHLYMRVLYAMGDNKKTFFSSIAGAISMVLVAYLWHKWTLFDPAPNFVLATLLKIADVPGIEVLALPIGFVFGVVVEMLTLWLVVESKIRFSRFLWKPIFHSFGAGLIGSTVSYVVLQYTGAYFALDKFVGLLMHAFVGGVAGILVAVATLVLLDNEEMRVLTGSLQRRFSGVKPIVTDTDVLS